MKENKVIKLPLYLKVPFINQEEEIFVEFVICMSHCTTSNLLLNMLNKIFTNYMQLGVSQVTGYPTNDQVKHPTRFIDLIFDNRKYMVHV